MKFKNLKEFVNNLEPQDLTETKEQLHDLFAIYLDTELAGDNQCRRKKLAAISLITKLLNNLI